MGRTVLVADPDPENRRHSRDSLRSAGYEVIEAGTGAEALQQSLLQWPDVLVLDAHLSDVTAWDVLEQLRSSSGVDEMRVVVCTEEDIGIAGDEIADVVPKAFDPSDLALAVDHALATEPRPSFETEAQARPKGKIDDVMAAQMEPGEYVAAQADALLKVTGQFFTRCKVVLTDRQFVILRQAWPWGYRVAESGPLSDCTLAHRNGRFDGTTLLDVSIGRQTSTVYFGRRWREQVATITAALGG